MVRWKKSICRIACGWRLSLTLTLMAFVQSWKTEINFVSHLITNSRSNGFLRPDGSFLRDSVACIRFKHDKLFSVKRDKRLRAFLEIMGRACCRLRLMMLFRRRVLRWFCKFEIAILEKSRRINPRTTFTTVATYFTSHVNDVPSTWVFLAHSWW